MWEIFIFVNPIGNRCLTTEKTIIQFAQQHKMSVHFKFIALNNVYAIDDYMQRNNLDLHNITLRNKVTEKIHQATLFYKAATFQGNKKGRNFLMSLQDAININHLTFNLDLVKSLAHQAHLDWETLVADKDSQLAFTQCQIDQQKAAQFKITAPPTTVIYDYSNYLCEQGVIIQACSLAQLQTFLNKLIKKDYQILLDRQLHTLE
ncbi:MAG: DsbA family protein [Lactobacillus sp.]|nr:DsbA family protein [Lactobacillus sp.]